MASARDHLTPNGVFVMYNIYREPWLVAKLDSDGDRHVRPAPLLRLSARARPSSPSGPAVDALGGRRAGRRASIRCPRRWRPRPKPATDDWPFLYLRDAADRAVLPRGPGVPARSSPSSRSLAATRARRRRGAAGSARTSSCSASRSCCSRRGASCRSASCSARRGSSTRWRSSRSSPACCSRSSSTPASGRAAAHPVRGAVRRDRRRVAAPADSLLIDPPRAALPARGGDRVRAGVLRQPRVRLLVPGHRDRRHGVRVEPGRGDGRRRAGVRGAAHRASRPCW